MEAGTLHITVLKGPKNGGTMVCKPGSTIRIGRVLKGNDFAVRDPGISQKHLCFQFLPEASRWFVSDLDSSNGTILNETKIQSLVPVPISHCDVIKIGEITELGVKIVSPESLGKNEEGNGAVKGRGVNTRRGLARVSNQEENRVQTVDPDFVPGAMHKTAQKGKARGQRRVDGKENADRVFKEQMDENKNVSAQVEKSDQTGGVKLRRNPRRGNSSRALKDVDMNCDAGVAVEAKGVHMKKKERKGKEIEVLNDELCTKNNKLVPETENDDSESDCVIIRNEECDFMDKTMAKFSMVTEEEKGSSNVGLKEGSEPNCEVGDPFEKMTLEQWFDSMELFLPKVIHDEAEAIINTLKEKARKFEEVIQAGGNV